MELIALRSFKVKSNNEIIEIEKGTTLVVPDDRAKPLIEKNLAQPLKPNSVVSLTPALERRLSAWDCENCSWFMGDECVCVVESKRAIHMIAVARLGACPRRNKKVRDAILRGDHLSWLN